MTTTEISEAVAREVMVWRFSSGDTGSGGADLWLLSEKATRHEGPSMMCHRWRPPTNIAQAFEVVERMRELGWRFALHEHHTELDTYIAKFYDKRGEPFHGVNKVPATDICIAIATAICIASLEAMRAGRGKRAL